MRLSCISAQCAHALLPVLANDMPWRSPMFARVDAPGLIRGEETARLLFGFSPCGGRTEVRPVLRCQRWLAPFSAQSNGGLDKDSGLYISLALALTPTIHLFNQRVIEQEAGRAPTGTFLNTAAIVARTRLIVSRLCERDFCLLRQACKQFRA